MTAAAIRMTGRPRVVIRLPGFICAHTLVVTRAVTRNAVRDVRREYTEPRLCEQHSDQGEHSQEEHTDKTHEG